MSFYNSNPIGSTTASAGMGNKNFNLAHYASKDCSGDPLFSVGTDLPGEIKKDDYWLPDSCDAALAALNDGKKESYSLKSLKSKIAFGECDDGTKTTCSTGMGAGMVVLVIFLVMLFLAGAAVGALCFLKCALTLPLPRAARPLPSSAAREFH